MNPQLIISNHAKKRMIQRHFNAKDICHVLNNFNISVPAGKPDRVRYAGTLTDGRTLNVVITPDLQEPGPYTVVTVY